MTGASLRTTDLGDTYALLADLPLQIESYSLEPLSQPMAPDRVRRTTVINLLGGGETALARTRHRSRPTRSPFSRRRPPCHWPAIGRSMFSSHLDTLDLFPSPPARDPLRSFRRWGFESAALDLALRQAQRSLAAALARPSRPLTFVNSIHLPADPPSFEPIRERLQLFGGLRFKLDPTSDWDEQLIDEIAATGAVETADLKSQYPPPFGQPADPHL